jgi:hypothetical protein
MPVFFKPSDIKTIECSVHNKTVGGSAFATCQNEDQVFISPKIVDTVNIEVGDFLTAYCIDNHRPENGGVERFSVRWRAIRVMVQEKFSPTVYGHPAAPPAAIPQPKPELTGEQIENLIMGIVQQDRAWTTAQAATEIGVDHMRVANVMRHLHEGGEIASCEINAKAGQERVSKLFYARDVDLLVDLIDEVVLDD